jgi:plastocyanin
MRILLVFWAVALCGGQLFGGTIEGTVRAEGKESAARGADAGGKYESRKFKFAEKVDYGAMREFVVYIEGPFKEKPVPPSKPVQIVTQKDATFRPHVLPVLVGTTVEWPNQDEILHNVFSDSDAAQFDLGLYSSKDPMRKVTFSKPGRVDVFCSIHSQMHCIVLVLESPFFTVTDDKNRYVLKNIPPGTYKISAWHERMPRLSEEVVVPDDPKPVHKDLVLGIKNLPQPTP